MKYIYSTSQISKLSLTLCTFSVTGSVAGLFLTITDIGSVCNLIFGKVAGITNKILTSCDTGAE